MSLIHGSKQIWLATVDGFVRSALVFDIVSDGLFVSVLANRVYIIPLRPELPAPQLALDFGVLFENHACRDAFRDLRKLVRGVRGNGLNEEVHMVFIRTDLMVSDLVPLLDAATHVLQRQGDLWGEYVPSVFHWADEVVQEERFVVTLQNVFAHLPILAPECPRSRAARQSLRVYKTFFPLPHDTRFELTSDAVPR